MLVVVYFLSEVSQIEQSKRATDFQMSVAQDVILHNCTEARELSQYIWGLYETLI